MITQSANKPSTFISLRVKLLVWFTLLFALAFAATFYWFYTFATQMALGRIREDLIETWLGTASQINGDDFGRLALMVDAPPEGVPENNPIYANELYLAHQHWLEQVYKVEPRAIPYTYIKSPTAEGDQRVILWVGDIFRIIRRDSRTKFLEPYDAGDSLLYNGLTEFTVRLSPQPDPWGTYVSAYGPIRNSKAEIVGGLGIDFRYQYVLDVQEAIKSRVVTAFVIAYTGFFAVIYLFSKYVTRPIVSLTGVANRIAEGDYQQDLTKISVSRFPDEINTLAGVFAIMIDKVRVREENLKKRVEELRIEIDEVKRQKQVDEIVESDFFRDLQVKARDMRERSRRSTKEMKQVKLNSEELDT